MGAQVEETIGKWINDPRSAGRALWLCVNKIT